MSYRLVGYMVVGSVPCAFLGAYILHLLGNSKSDQENIEIILGAALLVGAAAMVLRSFLDRRNKSPRIAAVQLGCLQAAVAERQRAPRPRARRRHANA